MNLIDEIRNPNCRLCPLHKSSVNVCVMGKGSVKSPIMLIGEAPGEAESETGKPFMGRSGKLLDGVLIELGIVDECYITNICKCRPPGNRTPTGDERYICTQTYLEREINVVDPAVIVCLGRTAIDYFWEGKRFVRHQEQRTHGRYTIPTWHPSYVLRTGSGLTLTHFKQALKRAKELAS